MADFRIVERLIREGYKSIAGVDEAGRGALFGPVVSVAVMFPVHLISDPPAPWMEELEDSKCLPSRKRSRLAKEIVLNARSIGVGFATNREIDERNIYWASFDAMKRAVDNMTSEPEFLLVDGFPIKNVSRPQRGIPQGDKKCSLIAAASILAKVLRDNIMMRLDSRYVGYGIGRHKGYGTKFHYEALSRMGPTELHRSSFRLSKGN